MLGLVKNSTRPTAWIQLAPGRPQAEIADAEREVAADLAGDRERLQRDGAIRPTDQHIGTETGGDRGLAAGADIVAGEEAGTPGGAGEHRPDHHARGGDADVEPE